ncbi:MAG: hypothetical protein AAB250_07570, partial [Bdellovibrionota bacterium]
MEFKRMTTAASVFATGLAALFLNSCAMKSETVAVSIKMPDWSQIRAADYAYRSKISTQSVTTADLNMIDVNVTGPGMAPVF